MPGIWGKILHRVVPSEDSLEETIKSIHLFETLSKSELAEILRIIHLRTYQAGETIFKQGHPGVAMYIVIEGMVQIVRSEEMSDEPQIITEVGEGEFFGELGLLDESPRSAGAVAARPSSIAAISRPDLMDLTHRNTSLGVKVLIPLSQLIVARLRYTNENLLEAIHDRTITRAKLEELSGESQGGAAQ